jgi:hypothetical protein
MWRRAAAVVGVLVLIAVAGFFLLGGDVPLLPDGDEGPSEFTFELNKVRAAPLGDEPATELQDEAQEAADAVKTTMDQLYFEAFVNRDAWGAYDEAYALFQGPAVARAEADAETLTLGAAAAADYASLQPILGRLNVVVLTNDENVAVSAIARVVFRADAELKAGGATKVGSVGAFFLRPSEEGWRIFAYRVDRNERPAPSPTPSPTEAS